MRSIVFPAITALAVCVLAALTTMKSSDHNDFGDIPASYLEGFKNPKIESSVSGKATCISGMVDVAAAATNIHINYNEPANHIEVTEFLVQALEIGSTLSKQLVGGPNNVSGTFGI
jgi:hypothetical protein